MHEQERPRLVRRGRETVRRGIDRARIRLTAPLFSTCTVRRPS